MLGCAELMRAVVQQDAFVDAAAHAGGKPRALCVCFEPLWPIESSICRAVRGQWHSCSGRGGWA